MDELLLNGGKMVAVTNFLKFITFVVGISIYSAEINKIIIKTHGVCLIDARTIMGF